VNLPETGVETGVVGGGVTGAVVVTGTATVPEITIPDDVVTEKDVTVWACVASAVVKSKSEAAAYLFMSISLIFEHSFLLTNMVGSRLLGFASLIWCVSGFGIEVAAGAALWRFLSGEGADLRSKAGEFRNRPRHILASKTREFRRSPILSP
jgi:hypothetical protein